MTPKDAESQIEGATQGARAKKKEVAGSGKEASGSKGATKGSARRTRSPHPGVVLKAPTPPRTAWRARYTDPDTGKEKYDSLDPLTVGRNAQSRRAWAIDKSRAIAKRRDELASGAPRATGTTIAAIVDRYFEDHPQLREGTRGLYRMATGKLLTWANAHGIRSADDLSGARLVALRSWLIKQPKRAVQAGARSGAKADTEELRKPNSVNIELRAIGTVLNYLRRLGLTPRLTLENIVDGLRKLPAAKDAGAFLRQGEIKALLEACRAHDAATFKATREEHAEGLEGRTPRYPAITPLILVALLTGMRFSELVDLDWSEVDLDEGEIRLGSGRTKTKHARTITFEHSPMLAELLTALHSEGATGRVWSMTTEQIRAASKRLARYGAPEGWSFQALRRTCGTYLTNAPGIFGAASAYRSARQLGHSVQVAERHYLGVVRVPKEATTLEDAMGIEEHLGGA